MPNGRLFQLEIVAGKKKEYLYESRFAWSLEVFEFQAVILPCTGVGWREDVLRFNRRKPVNNFVKKKLDVDLAFDCQGIANLSSSM